MKKGLLNRSFFYRHRVIVGFIMLASIAAWMAAFRFWSFPGGLTDTEISSATISGHWSIASIQSGADWVVNLPWHILQWASMSIFGPSIFSIRLPAVILMFLVAIGLFFLLKKWSRWSLAMIGGLLSVSSTLFISLSRNGDSSAMTTFLIVAAIMAATIIIIKGKSKATHILSTAAIGLSLALLFYAPGGVYISIVLIAAGMLHPKVRFLVVRSKVYKTILGLATIVALLMPLILGVALHWNEGGSKALSELLLFNSSWSLGNLTLVLDAIFGVSPGFNNGIITPVITMAGLIIVIIGIARAVTDISSARSYLVLSLLISVLILSLGQPNLIYLLFIPFAVLITIGAEVLISKWYSLFPINPYARVFAFIPLTILILTLALTSINQYVSTQNYSPSVVHEYNTEFEAVRRVINKGGVNNAVLVVDKDQIELYYLLQRKSPGLEVTTKFANGRNNIVLYSAGVKPYNTIPDEIITNWHTQDEALIKIYK